MRTWSFTLHVGNATEMTEELANRLYEAGCRDSSPSSSNGLVEVSFDREAESLETAIRSAVADVLKAGLVTGRVEIDHEELSEWSKA